MTMKTRIIFASGSGISQSEAQTAFEAALQNNFPFNNTEQRMHNCGVTAIPAQASLPAEIRIDDATVGAPLVSAAKALVAGCTFGEPIEIMVGASAATAVQRAVMNRGGFNPVTPMQIAAGQRIFVRTLSTNTVTEGLLTINLLG